MEALSKNDLAAAAPLLVSMTTNPSTLPLPLQLSSLLFVIVLLHMGSCRWPEAIAIATRPMAATATATVTALATFAGPPIATVTATALATFAGPPAY
jgi:hypothetical protein